MTPYLDDGDVVVHVGDCIEVMAALPAASIDAIVTDPPYGLEFMGREWDAFTPAAFESWCEAWAIEAIRVLKPGGHLIAFGGTRTFHRLTCGLEDSGFEIRDCLSWLFGSGFPKSLDVSKAIDKAAGAERAVVRVERSPFRMADPKMGNALNSTQAGDSRDVDADGYIVRPITAPATDAAREWDGWGTALKPGWEPAVLARKPLAGTVARNVTEHGTGALNIDGCRIEHGSDVDLTCEQRQQSDSAWFGGGGKAGHVQPLYSPHGRWPANVLLDEHAAALLDAQVGELTSGANPTRRGSDKLRIAYGDFTGQPECVAHRGKDTGGPSRFFYTAKASTSERNNGHGPANTHPTVKPVDLMRWLVRLVTPPGGVVLDPFAGSGTTGVAARAEGHRAVLIEREAEYLQIIAGRLAQQSLFATTRGVSS